MMMVSIVCITFTRSEDHASLRQHVIHGGTLARLFDDAAQLLWIVTPHDERDLDLLIAIADLVGKAQQGEQINVALNSRADVGEIDATRRGDIR